jgi:hypothetical protein
LKNRRLKKVIASFDYAHPVFGRSSGKSASHVESDIEAKADLVRRCMDIMASTRMV